MSNNQVEYGIRINIDGNRAASDAIDQVATATDKLTVSAEKANQSLTVTNGQMNDTAAIMRKNAEATSLASEAAQKFLAPLQREVDLFGASRSEVEKYRASKAGLSAVVQQQAASLGAAIDAMHRDEEAARLVAAEQDRAAKAAEQFLNKLRDQVATLNMNTAQLQAYRAAQLGVTDAAAPLIAKLSEAGSGANTAGKHMETLSFQSAGARRELLVLLHELSQGNFQRFGGSMMVLGEQTGAAGLLFSGAGIAALALVGALAAVTYAVVKGAAEQRAMNNALIETGNYAGTTSDSLNDMAHAAVAAGGSIRDAKKVVTELAGSGKFTSDQIGYITDAAIAMEHATGKSVEKTIQEFESLAVQTSGSSLRSTEAISRAALKLDDTYHFLTESVYEQIRALEKEGDQKGASALATETLAKVTKERADEMAGNIGSIQKGWNSVKETIGGVIDALGDLGKKATPQDAIDKYKSILEHMDAQPGWISGNGQGGNAQKQFDDSRLRVVQALTAAVIEKNNADAAAIQQGKAAQAQSEAAHAASRIEQDDIRLGKKGMSELDDAIQKYGEDLAKIAAANPTSKLLDQDVVNEHMALLLKAHTAAAKGNDDRAKLLQDALTVQQTALEREKSIYDARENMLSLYHAKFSLSDDDFYAGRANARAEYIAAEAITFAKETALVQSMIAKTPQEVAAQKAKYDELVKAHLKFVDDMRNAGGVDVLTQLAGSEADIKASDDAINKFMSSLDQEAQKLEDNNKKHEESRSAVERETIALIDQAIAYQRLFVLEQAQEGARADEMQQGQALLKFLEDQRAARERIANALDTSEADAASKKAADKAAHEWDETSKHIQTTLADAIMNGGSNAWKKLRTAIAQQVLQVPLQYIGNMGASFMVPTAAQADASTNASGTTGAGTGAIGNVMAASSLYKTVSGGFGQVGSSIANGYDSIAGMFGPSTIGSTGPSAMGSTLGSYGQVAAGAIAGHYVGGAISGEYGSQSTTNVTQAIGTAIGAYLGGTGGAAIGSFIGGAVGGLLNRAFGMGDKKITDTGMRGSVSDSGVTGSNYQDWHQDGGWFRSDKNGTDTPAFSSDVVKQFTEGFSAIKTASSGFAAELGMSIDAIKSYSKDFNITLTSDTTANQKAITDLFSTIGDEMAQRLVPNVDQFSKSGETAAATLERMAGEFKATNQVAQVLGTTAQTMFGAAGIESTAARERLIDLAGGVGALSQQATFFAQNFMTEAERLAPVSAALDTALASLGLKSIPTTRAEFKALANNLVTSGAVATEAGAKQYASLMALAEAFAQVHPEVESTTNSISDARAALTEAYQNEADAIKETNDRMSSFATSLRGLRESALLGDMSPLTPEQKYAEARSQFESTLAAARAGDATAQGNYEAAYNAFLNASKAVNASGDAYQRDFAYAQSATEEAIGWAEKQVDVGQASLTALQQQVSGLIDVKTTVQTTGEALREAIDNLATAMGASGAGVAATANTNALESLYQSMLGRSSDSAGLQYWQQAMANGMNISDVASYFAQSDEYLGIHGSHANGLSRVPFDGYIAELHQDEAVLTAQEANSWRSMGPMSMAPLVAEIKALRASNEAMATELKGLREDQERQAGDQAEATVVAADESANKIVDAVGATKTVQVRETRVMPA